MSIRKHHTNLAAASCVCSSLTTTLFGACSQGAATFISSRLVEMQKYESACSNKAAAGSSLTLTLEVK